MSPSYFTMGYNVLKETVLIFTRLLAGSLALVEFGLDSLCRILVWDCNGLEIQGT